MDMKRHLKSALKQLGFDKPRKAQIIPMNTLDAEQDAIVIAATGSGKQVIYETVGLAHSDKLTIVIEPLLALIYNQVQTLQKHDVSADYIDMTRSKEDIDKILNKARKGKLNFLCHTGALTKSFVYRSYAAFGYLYGRNRRMPLHYGMGLYVS